MSAPMPPQLLVVCQARLHLCQVRTNDGIPKIVKLGWGAPSIYMKNLYLVLGIGKYSYREYFYNHYAGVAALAGNKRRQKDLKDEATKAEFINCIAQRLAKMPSPLSSKWIYRMATMAEITNPMEEIDADVPEMTGLWEQFGQTGVTNEVMQTSGYTQIVQLASNGHMLTLQSTKRQEGKLLKRLYSSTNPFPLLRTLVMAPCRI